MKSTQVAIHCEYAHALVHAEFDALNDLLFVITGYLRRIRKNDYCFLF